jgi:hypothetical protein
MKPGYGTIDNPMDLAIALTYPFVLPGQSVYLRGGVYYGDFVCNLAGAADEPIIIQPYPGEQAIIDGDVQISGQYTTWKNIVFRYSGWATRQSSSTSSPLPSSKGINISTVGGKFINCIFHDLDGMGFWMNAVGAEFYGNLIYYIGWNGTDRGHGHSLYTQNQTGRKLIKHNLMHSSFGWGIHIYSGGSAYIDNFDIVENTLFQSGILSGNERPNILLGGDTKAANDCVADGNLSYGAAAGLQSYGQGFRNLAARNNYFPNGLNYNLASDTFAEDTGNTLGTVGNQVFVHPNAYQTDRANVTVYNEAGADSVTVDLSAVAGLAAGDSVTVRNVQDYFVDIQTLTLDANKQITVDMQAANRTVAAPVAWTAPPTTFPAFGAFVVEKA